MASRRRAEDAEIVTFRVQAEIDVPRFQAKLLPPGDGNSARAILGERPLYDLERELHSGRDL